MLKQSYPKNFLFLFKTFEILAPIVLTVLVLNRNLRKGKFNYSKNFFFEQ
jgi:hypothetical protein